MSQIYLIYSINLQILKIISKYLLNILSFKKKSPIFQTNKIISFDLLKLFLQNIRLLKSFKIIQIIQSPISLLLPKSVSHSPSIPKSLKLVCKLNTIITWRHHMEGRSAGVSSSDLSKKGVTLPCHIFAKPSNSIASRSKTASRFQARLLIPSGFNRVPVEPSFA